MPGGSDEKPFKCNEHGCGQTFINEDHLNVHRLKHQMSLTLTPGMGNKFLFADQTPTPTKFLRYGEELGLFNDLNKNPFDDAFKQATDIQRYKFTPTSESVGLPGTSTDQDTLNTPTPHLHIPHRHPDTPDTPIKKRYRFLDPVDPEPTYIPLPGPGVTDITSDTILNDPPNTSAAPRGERVESNMSSTTVSSIDNSIGPASQESQSSVLEVIEDAVFSQDISQVSTTTAPVTGNKPLSTSHNIETLQQQRQAQRPFNIELNQSSQSSSPLTSPQSTTSSTEVPNQSKGSKLEKIASHLSAKRPTTLAGIVTGGSGLVPSGGQLMTTTTTEKTQPVPILPIKPLNNAIPVATPSGSQQYMLQVMVQTPEGKMMPVHIPAALAVPGTGGAAVVKQETVSSSKPIQKAEIVTSTKHSPVSTTTHSTNVSLLTKRKLKEAIQQNSPIGNKVFVTSISSTNRTASVSSQFSPSYSNPPTPLSVDSLDEVEYQDADSSMGLPTTTSSSSKDEDPDDKRRKFLERNRAAAARCRNKKKKWVNNLESKAEELQAINTRLQNEVTQLRAEMAQLKALLLAHKDCPITVQQRNAGQLTLQRVPDVESGDVQMVPVATIPMASKAKTPVTLNQPITTHITNKPVAAQFITLPGTFAIKQEDGSLAQQIAIPTAGATSQGQIVAVDLSKVRSTLPNIQLKTDRL